MMPCSVTLRAARPLRARRPSVATLSKVVGLHMTV